MLSVDLCSVCGNNHSGTCSVEPLYFYWHPYDLSNPPKYVQIAGDWHKWQKYEEMSREVDEKGEIYFETLINIPVGKHQYKFIVDGKWQYDETAPTVEDGYGSKNNIVEVRFV